MLAAISKSVPRNEAPSSEVEPDALRDSTRTDHVKPARPAMSLRSASSWMLAGNVVYAASQWGLLAILARLESTSAVGQLVFALTVSAPVAAFCMLHLRRVQTTDALGDYRFGHYLALRFLMTGLLLTLVPIIGFTLTREADTRWIVVAVAAIAATDAFGDTLHGFLQQHERVDFIARALILKGLGSVTAFALATWLTGWFFYGLCAVALWRAGVMIAYDVPNLLRVARLGGLAGSGFTLLLCWDRSKLLSLFRLALPLGLVMMLVVLCGNLPRYFLEEYQSEAALGIFGAIGYLNVAGSLVVGAIGEASNARMARLYVTGERRRFLGLTCQLGAMAAGLGILGTAIAAALGGPILNLLYGPEYAAEAGILTLVMVASSLGYVASILGYAVSAARYFRIQLPLFAAVVVVTAIACQWLVPTLGLRGAAYALIASSATQLLGFVGVLLLALRSDCPSQTSEPSVPPAPQA